MRMFAKAALAGLILGLLASTASAQFGDPAALEDNYQAKLKKSFMKKIAWETSLEAALAKSKETKLPVLAYFTRSYAP